MSRFSDAAYEVMRKQQIATMSSHDLWEQLQEAEPQLTAITPTRKTPRTTAMRDLRKDGRFIVGGGTVSLR